MDLYTNQRLKVERGVAYGHVTNFEILGPDPLITCDRKELSAWNLVQT